ncbi:hypothetical protein [Planctomycetes bacterium K23_9]|uniref:Uncharacterized protein n=1 Tax=Stieleria marina TaxID=1930275 RepID=A0A517NYZ4_9BACT|nr:hypothetical protein K239x_43580 [Planctomycetes bacterium K23_9]
MTEIAVRQCLGVLKSDSKSQVFQLLAFFVLVCVCTVCCAQSPSRNPFKRAGSECDCAVCSAPTEAAKSACDLDPLSHENAKVAECSAGTGKLHWSSQRLLPPGNLVGRIPYTSMQQYYYHRPYSPSHVSAKSHSADVFEEVYRHVERQAMELSSEDMVAKDRAFEFSDWREYRRARLAWEAKTESDATLGQSVSDETLSQTLSDLLK